MKNGFEMIRTRTFTTDLPIHLAVASLMIFATPIACILATGPTFINGMSRYEGVFVGSHAVCSSVKSLMVLYLSQFLS